MSSDLALSIDGLSKTYHLYDDPKDRLKQMLFRKRQYYRTYDALKPMSLQLPRGEVLGVVGRNGAGKSTLLQLICGTLAPTTGGVQVNGRIAALLELGAGFNPQFTGRENIYLAASIMGVQRQDIDAKIDEIIDFSGVRHFIDQPVSTYSSGMYVRLAFSVATSIEPDILIIDEALSVGDGDFARRSFERIMAMKERGATILFCSHSLYQIEVLCSQAIWLERGELIQTGKPDDIVPQYQAFLDRLSHNPEARPNDVSSVEQRTSSLEEVVQPALTESSDSPHSLAHDAASEYARLTKVQASTESAAGAVLDIDSGKTDLKLDIEFKSTLKNEQPQLAIAIHNAAGQLVSSAGAWTSGVQPTVNQDGVGRVTLTLPQLPLLKGTYHVGVLLFCQRGLFLHDEADPVVTLHVHQTGQERGLVMLPHAWHVATPKARLSEQVSVSRRQPSDRWQVRPAQENDFEAIQRVYQDAFGHVLDRDLWQWKYRHADSPGFVVLEGETIVAFCGGAPRQGWVQGEPATFCQIGDVMVSSKQRGILTKTGPFYRAVYPFMGQLIGAGKHWRFAFGFPNERHLRVGQRQGLYAKFDEVLEVTWPAAPHHYHLRSWSGEAQLAERIDQHWQAMKPHLERYLVGARDQAWLRYRYLEKPHGGYQIWLVTPKEQAHTIAVIVLKDRPESNAMELLDFIVEPPQAEQMLAAAQQVVAQQQRQQLFAWLTPNVYQWLENSGGQVCETDIVVPGNGMDDPEHTRVAMGNWWLMGGDSDFR